MYVCLYVYIYVKPNPNLPPPQKNNKQEMQQQLVNCSSKGPNTANTNIFILKQNQESVFSEAH